SSARTGRVSPPWSSYWRRCTSPTRGGSSSTGATWPAWRPTPGENGSPAPSRTSRASSTRCGCPSAWATCPGPGTRAPWTGRASADARPLVDRLDRGLHTQLGSTWAQGAELSEGQWQKIALARGYMRDHPLLLLLDEPASALDAATEHLLFEQYAERARTLRDGDHITLLVSHRFSTVRMADHIVVMDGARVIEQG